MAGDEKTSEYGSIVGADIVFGDLVEVVDLSEPLDADKNKSATMEEFFKFAFLPRYTVLTGVNVASGDMMMIRDISGTAENKSITVDEFFEYLFINAWGAIPAVASGDLIPIVDVSATPDENKYVTVANLEAALDHDNLVNNHNLSTDIDHDGLTNTHDLTTDINHDAITNTHNLTTDINHDAITNFVADEHIDWTDPAHSGNPFTLGASSELTIATGVITVTGSLHTVDTESDGATDDLDTINGGVAGQILVLMAENGARDVVVKDGTGNLALAGDFTMDTTDDTITLMWVGAQWVELFRSNNA